MDMEVMEPLYEFRNKCVRDGATHPALDKVVEGLRKTNSMVPVRGKRGDWAAGLNVKDATKEQVEVLYFVGCATSFDPKLQKGARATVKILQAAGVDFGIAGNAEMCSGGRTYQMGYEEDARKQAKRNTMFVKRAGVKTVIASCADCYQAFNVNYDKFGMKGDLKVFHVTEFIDKLLKEGQLKLTRPVNLNVTYHDPCYLGRLGEPWKKWEGKRKPGNRFMFDPPKEYRRGEHGVYQPPRDVLESIPGLVLSEMPRNKEHAWCCGAGGGVNDSNPEFALWTGKERVNEAKSTGAEALVTACPWCETTFNESSKASGTDLAVYDIVELVEKAL
jgi:Fe-S oxidoreductase